MRRSLGLLRPQLAKLIWAPQVLPLVACVILFCLLTNAWSADRCASLFVTLNAQKFTNDKRFLPDEKSQTKKVDAIAQLVSAINENNFPDLIAMIESDSTLIEKLLRHPLLKESGLVFHGTSPLPDIRGNNLGLVTRFPLVSTPISHVYWNINEPIWQERSKHSRRRFSNGYLTRPIMEYRLMLPNGEELIVFVNHWPSKKSGDVAAQQRLQAARYLRALVDQILTAKPDANVMILGDFNSTPDEPEIRDVLIAHPSGPIVNLEETAMQKSRGSIYYSVTGEWSLFDQIIVSRNLLQYFSREEYGPHLDSRFVSPDGVPIPFDFENGTGATDHLPVAAVFRFNSQNGESN